MIDEQGSSKLTKARRQCSKFINSGRWMQLQRAGSVMCDPSLGINSYCSVNPQLEAAGRLQSCQRWRAGASLLCECVRINLNVALYIVVYIYISAAASSFVVLSWEFGQPPLKLYFEMKACTVLSALGMCACLCTIFWSQLGPFPKHHPC